MTRLNSHTTILDNLESLVHANYTEREIEYVDPKTKQVLGEIDLLLWYDKPNKVQLYEVKSNRSPVNLVKAIKQLRRHRDVYLPQFFELPYLDVEYYFVYGKRKDNYNPLIYQIHPSFIQNQHRGDFKRIFL